MPCHACQISQHARFPCLHLCRESKVRESFIDLGHNLCERLIQDIHLCFTDLSVCNETHNIGMPGGGYNASRLQGCNNLFRTTALLPAVAMHNMWFYRLRIGP